MLANRVALAIQELEKIQAAIRVCAKETRRRPFTKTATRSQPVTPEIKALVRRMKREHPGLSQAAIGRHFNINAGRVSEILRGKRQ